MIRETSADYTVQSTMGGNRVEMSIDASALAHIMGILTDLYSDPEIAIIREYSTNAFDAHVEIGNTAPIEVTTPTPLSPFLIIEDHGVGMSEQDIVDIYSKYGASTKTHTNDQNGMLGLGCKSALTYTNQFTLVGVKDDLSCSVSISRDENGVGTMTVLESVPTDAHSGVKVIIPVKRVNEIDQKARDFFQHWKPGTVLLNGKAPDRLQGFKINDHITLVKSGPHCVVMGNVAYPIDFPTAGHDLELPRDHGVVAHVPIGAIHFTPNREALHYTPKTKEVIKQIAETVKADLPARINDEISNAKTPFEAIRSLAYWRSILPPAMRPDQWTYQGRTLPDTVTAPDNDPYFVTSGTIGEAFWGEKVGAHSKTRHLEITMLADVIWVHGFERSFTPTVKKKLVHWCQTKGITAPARFILSAQKPLCLEWIDPALVFPWEPIGELKLPRRNKSGKMETGRIAGSYDCYINGRFKPGVPADDIDTSDPVLYTLVGDDYYNASQFLQRVLDDYTFVELSSNRIAKFCRLFPEALEVDKFIQDNVKFWVEMLNQTDREMLWLHFNGSYNRRDITKLQSSRIDDPALKRVIKIARAVYTHSLVGVDTTKFLKEAMGLPRSAMLKALQPYKVTDPMVRYPYYDPYKHGQNREHSYVYLNAAYHAFYEQETN